MKSNITIVSATIALSFSSSMPAMAQSVQIEPGAYVSVSHAAVNAAVGLIRSRGYKCTSVSAMNKFVMS